MNWFVTDFAFLVPIFAFLIPAFVLFQFYKVYRGSQQQLPIEQENADKLVLTTRCGGKAGKLWYRGAFIRVSLYRDFMVISTRQKFVLHYARINSVTCKGILTKYLCIEYDEGKLGSFELALTNPQKIETILNKLIPSASTP